ncbi:MAG: hypothetical protein OXQ28_00285 [Acidobacteriota bacterium]|nr:hypothetical protein [Acidobacteriota bacterium]
MAGVRISDSAWTEVTSPLGMTDGDTYAFQIHGNLDQRIYAHDVTDGSAPTSTEDAQVLFAQDERPLEQLEYTKRAGVTWWLRVDQGSARIAAWGV